MESVAVVAVPFPAQGHLNTLLHLSLRLASCGLPVHYAAPAPHVRQARARVHGWDPRAVRAIRFHDLDLPAYEHPPPDPTVATSFPSHLMPLLDAFVAHARAPLAGLLERVSARHRRVVVLYDRLSSFAAAEAARLPNGEAFCMQCVAVSYNVAIKDAGHRLLHDHDMVFHPVDVCMSEEFIEYIARTWDDCQGAAVGGMVLNTCRALEGEFIDEEAKSPEYTGQRIFAVGPLNPLLDAGARTPGQSRHECLDWLDRQPPASVLYVSFGTTSSLLAEQAAEIAAALRDSKQRFIWVLRDADRGVTDVVHEEEGAEAESPHATMLSEFTTQTEGTGVVITGWAPQLEILAHDATAAFMSHCGWNSTMESLSYGKPILAWPMHSDQPWDAELICKYLKAGLLVRPLEKRSAVVPSEAIREVIEKAMVSKEGLQMRKRAEKLGESIRASVADGGSSHKDLEEFIAHITR
ncbi:cis-zeatin O-glucosyltransferase 1-like [Lolium rigidum]|uniref:cis-zeatin O-glucosyltransferase 1-like n=1 Tax=Lolium rigidum TaxID=89674 RepID=UPI001F5CDACF|nr:cis-zeatin O-glucosyltransferase 1-like [Lolium rigidum]